MGGLPMMQQRNLLATLDWVFDRLTWGAKWPVSGLGVADMDSELEKLKAKAMAHISAGEVSHQMLEELVGQSNTLNAEAELEFVVWLLSKATNRPSLNQETQQRVVQEMWHRFCQEEKCEGNLQYGPGEEFVISRTYSFSNGESWLWVKGSFDYVTGYISGWLNGKAELRLIDTE
jgi:hypothetical protein